MQSNQIQAQKQPSSHPFESQSYLLSLNRLALDSEVSDIRLMRLALRIIQLRKRHSITQLHLTAPALNRALRTHGDKVICSGGRRSEQHVSADEVVCPGVEEVLEGRWRRVDADRGPSVLAGNIVVDVESEELDGLGAHNLVGIRGVLVDGV